MLCHLRRGAGTPIGPKHCCLTSLTSSLAHGLLQRSIGSDCAPGNLRSMLADTAVPVRTLADLCGPWMLSSGVGGGRACKVSVVTNSTAAFTLCMPARPRPSFSIAWLQRHICLSCWPRRVSCVSQWVPPLTFRWPRLSMMMMIDTLWIPLGHGQAQSGGISSQAGCRKPTGLLMRHRPRNHTDDGSPTCPGNIVLHSSRCVVIVFLDMSTQSAPSTTRLPSYVTLDSGLWSVRNFELSMCRFMG